jgi:hypothetical protein
MLRRTIVIPFILLTLVLIEYALDGSMTSYVCQPLLATKIYDRQVKWIQRHWEAW